MREKLTAKNFNPENFKLNELQQADSKELAKIIFRLAFKLAEAEEERDAAQEEADYLVDLT